jgi:hypothetical protein
MFADLLRGRDQLLHAKPFIASREYSTVTVNLNEEMPALELNCYPLITYVPISIGALPAWKNWLADGRSGGAPVGPNQLAFVENVAIAADLRRATSDYINSVIVHHPDLGDRYVSIRNDVLLQHWQRSLQTPNVQTPNSEKADPAKGNAG